MVLSYSGDSVGSSAGSNLTTNWFNLKWLPPSLAACGGGARRVSNSLGGPAAGARGWQHSSFREPGTGAGIGPCPLGLPPQPHWSCYFTHSHGWANHQLQVNTSRSKIFCICTCSFCIFNQILMDFILVHPLSIWNQAIHNGNKLCDWSPLRRDKEAMVKITALKWLCGLSRCLKF